MRIYLIILILLFSVSVVTAQNYQIDWYVIASGGGHSESATYQIDGTIGQPIVGVSSSPNYSVDAGFWVGAGEVGPSGYEYIPGDVNMALGIWPPTVIGGDVTYLVGYFIGGGQASCMLDDFWCSADINGDCLIIGGDVTALVQYFVAGGALVPCPDYESAWLEGVPDDQPAGWPNCDAPVINSRVIPTGSVK